MKIKLMIIIFAILLLLGAAAETAYAEEDIFDKIEETVEKETDTLDISDFERFASELEDNIIGEGGIRQFIKDLTKGKISLSPEELIKEMLKRSLAGFTALLPQLLSIVAVAVLFSLIFGLTGSFVNKQTVQIVYFVCYAAIVVIVITLIAKVVLDIRNTVAVLTSLMKAIFPPLITLMSALGGTVSTTVYKPQLALFSTLAAGVVTTVVLPLFIVSVIFSVVGNLTDSVKLEKLQSAVRYISTWVLSLTFGLYILYITVTGITGGLVDTVSIKAAKFMVSSYVPILGGYLSQGFDLITASLVLIKNSLGVAGVLITIGIIIAPVIKLITLTIGLKLIAGIIESIADKKLSDFLSGVADCTTQLIGALLGVGFVFLVTLLLVICTCNAGVV